MRLIERIEINKIMESKYIRADVFWNRIAGSAFFHTAEKAKIQFAIENEPGEDVTPVVHAHWIPEYPNKRTGKAYWHKCSECGRSVFDNRQVSIDEMGYAFCPHCGAKMDEEEGK